VYMRVYLCMCVCMYECVSVCVYVARQKNCTGKFFSHTYVCLSMSVYVYVCLGVCMCIYIRVAHLDNRAGKFIMRHKGTRCALH